MITTSEELEELVDTTVTIPTIPSILMEMKAVLDSPDGSTADAAAIIERDPAVAAKALRLVNSPLYGLRNPISGIPLACSILGLKVVHNLIVQATVLENFATGPELDNFDVNWLWDHSFKTAMAAKMLAKEGVIEVDMTPDDAYTAGLIHDVGKMILLQSQADMFAEALKNSCTNGIPLAKAEAALFGFSHAHVGGLLAQRWKLAPTLQAAVMYHHSPGTEAETWALGFLIKAANTLAHEASGPGGGYSGDLTDADALEALGLPDGRWEEIVDEIRNVSLDG